jgi:hypothetical protein
VNALRGSHLDVARALTPALALNAMLLAALVLTDWAFASIGASDPYVQMVCLAVTGSACYFAALLLVPLKPLQGEAARWRARINSALGLVGIKR